MEITHQQLGYEIYNSCKPKLEKLLVAYNQGDKHLKNYKVYQREDIDDQEVIIAFMWAIFDLLNMNPKYEKTTRFIFGAYVSDQEFSKNEADEEMRRLEKKFIEYKDLFRKEGKTDYNYLPVAMKMTEYITGGMVNLYFSTALVVSLQEFALMWGKLLKDTVIID